MENNKQIEKQMKNNPKKKNNNHEIKKGFSTILTKLKLQTAKLGTNISLAILSKPNKVYKTTFELDVPYDKSIDNQNPHDLQKMDVFSPLDVTKPLPVIFFMHGGAWSSGDKAYYSEFCQKLCEAQFIVININYRLIPDFSLKDIVKDCANAIKYALKNYKKYNIDRNNIFMIGDSAGAHLSSLLAGKWTMKGTKLLKDIRALGLYYGAYNLNTFSKSKFAILRTLDEYFNNIMPKNKIKAFYDKHSPISYLSPTFPPCLVISGKIDKLHEQSLDFVSQLEQHKLEYETLFFEQNRIDALHGFLNFINSKTSQTAYDNIIDFFKKHIK